MSEVPGEHGHFRQRPGEPEVAHELGGFRAPETLMSFLGLVLLVSR